MSLLWYVIFDRLHKMRITLRQRLCTEYLEIIGKEVIQGLTVDLFTGSGFFDFFWVPD